MVATTKKNSLGPWFGIDRTFAGKVYNGCMSDNLSKDRLVRNEQILRDKNTSVKNAIKKYAHDNTKVKATLINFVCECSALDCNERVKLSINAYEKIHKRKDRFAIAKGHETPIVEKLVADKENFRVVEKHELSP